MTFSSQKLCWGGLRWFRGVGGQVKREGGEAVDGHWWGGGVPSACGPSLGALSMDGLACCSPCRRCGPGSHRLTRPLISQEALLRLPPGHGCHRVWRVSSMRRAPYWVVGVDGEDLRVGQLRLLRLWEHRGRLVSFTCLSLVTPSHALIQMKTYAHSCYLLFALVLKKQSYKADLYTGTLVLF